MIVFVDMEAPDRGFDWGGEPPCDGPPCDEGVWELTRKRGMALDFLLPGRAMQADPGEPGRFTYRSPADKALAEFIDGLNPEEFGTWSDMVMAALMFLRQWLRDHQSLRDHPAAACLILALLALTLLLRAVLREPREPGRLGCPGDASIRGPSAPLVRAHAILTAAPPCSPAPVLAGVAA